MAIEATITDLLKWSAAWEELATLLERMPLPERHRARELHQTLGDLAVLNVDVRTAFQRLVRGMPEHATVIEDFLRRDGYDLDGC